MTQRDSEPGGGLALTTTWKPGEVLLDNHGILVPLDTRPGRYQLVVGLYLLTDPAVRLPVTLDGDPAGDMILLPPITVAAD